MNKTPREMRLERALEQCLRDSGDVMAYDKVKATCERVGLQLDWFGPEPEGRAVWTETDAELVDAVEQSVYADLFVRVQKLEQWLESVEVTVCDAREFQRLDADNARLRTEIAVLRAGGAT